MPRTLTKRERENIVWKHHETWICLYGMREAFKLSKMLRKVFLNEKNNNRKETKMEIKREKAIEIFKALGFKTSDSWPNARLEQQLNKLPELVVNSEAQMENIPSELKEKIKILTDLINNDEIVRIKQDINVDQKGEKEMKVKTKQKEKTKTIEQKVQKEVDAFGNRIGTRASIINKAIPKKEFTIEDIVKATNFTRTNVYDQIWLLVKKGFLKKTEKGYILIKKQS